MKRHGLVFGAATLAALLAGGARAEVRPHPLFTDGAVLQRDRAVPVFGTAAPGEEVTVTFGEATATAKAGPDGRWQASLPAMKANAKPTDLIIAGKNKVTVKNVLVGDVWVCSGQSNMEWSNFASAEPEKTIAAANHPGIRLFTVPKMPAPYPTKEVNAKWLPCTPQNAGPFSAVGYHFGLNLHKELGVPIGLLHSSWGGTICEAWTSKESLEKPNLKYLLGNYENGLVAYEKSMDSFLDGLGKYAEEVRKARMARQAVPPLPTPPVMAGPNIATVLSNGMIEPLIPYAIKGAIWYQGESNAGRAYEYRELLPTMIADWRARWGQGDDFPFLVVQLAPFVARRANPPVPAAKLSELPPEESGWAELREAQLLTAKNVKNVGLAVITDLVDDPYDIHPKQKAEVGRRLSLAARKIAYGQDLVYSGPTLKSVKFDGNKAVLSFDSVGGGLIAKGEKLTGFTVAGEDHKFVKADAVIQGDTVVVSAAGVEKPVAVRFGWADCPVLNFFNKEGLPASPFRTDDLPGVTQPKK
jgi:sialate O-acetylesterase